MDEDERKVEREGGKMRCVGGKLGAFMPPSTALNYHNSSVKAGMENSAGQSWGQHLLQYSISNLYTYSPINYTAHSAQ